MPGCICFVLIGLLLGGGLPVWAQPQPGGVARNGVQELFEEAQRYHLGIDTPVDYRQAFARYQEIVKRDPRFTDAYYNMAHICFAQKRYDLAADFYQRVIRLDPQDADAHNNLGAVYQRQGKVEAAKAAFLKALSLNRELAMAYVNLTYLFLAEGDREKAEKAIDQAVRLEPENPDFVRLQARIKGGAGRVSNWAVVGVVGAFTGIVVGYYFLFGRRGV